MIIRPQRFNALQNPYKNDKYDDGSEEVLYINTNNEFDEEVGEAHVLTVDSNALEKKYKVLENNISANSLLANAEEDAVIFGDNDDNVGDSHDNEDEDDDADSDDDDNNDEDIGEEVGEDVDDIIEGAKEGNDNDDENDYADLFVEDITDEYEQLFEEPVTQISVEDEELEGKNQNWRELFVEYDSETSENFTEVITEFSTEENTREKYEEKPNEFVTKLAKTYLIESVETNMEIYDEAYYEETVANDDNDSNDNEDTTDETNKKEPETETENYEEQAGERVSYKYTSNNQFKVRLNLKSLHSCV